MIERLDAALSFYSITKLTSHEHLSDAFLCSYENRFGYSVVFFYFKQFKEKNIKMLLFY